MELRTLHQSELDAWFSHCAGVFFPKEYDKGLAYFKRHFYNDPWASINSIFVAMDGSEIASTVRVFLREMYVGGQRVKMGGIGEVSTKPAYQKQGLSGKLLECSIAWMVENETPTSLLFAGPKDHYRKYGWASLLRTTAQSKAECLPTLPPDLSVRKMEASEKDILHGLYDLSAARFDGTIVRANTMYWDTWIAAEWKDVYVLEHERAPVAYIECSTEDETLTVREFCALPNFGAYAPAMARAVAEQNNILTLHMDAQLLQSEQTKTDDGMMVRLNAPFVLLGQTILTTQDLVEAMKHPASFSADGF